MKQKKPVEYLLVAVWVLGLFSLTGFSKSSNISEMSTELNAPQTVTVGPVLTIPTEIPAAANGTVVIPVQFTSNGNDVSSLAFSIDYSNTWLDINVSDPFSITFNLPSGFAGDCVVDKTDTNGEIDCHVLDPVVPLGSLPDSVIASVRLTTLNAPTGTIAPVGFSQDPSVSYGGPDGSDVIGSSTDGSVLIVTEPTSPSNLIAHLYSCSIQLSWQDNSENEEGFRIERRTSILPYQVIDIVGPNITSYMDTGLSPNTLYTYRVSAYNIAGSSYTNEAFATTDAVCQYKLYMPLVSSNYATGSSISGKVKDQGGLPVAGAVVCGDGNCDSVDVNGDYVIIGLADGSYNISATAEGYVCSADFSNPVSVPPSHANMDFTCVEGIGSTITGTIVDLGGNPLHGVLVADSVHGYSATTDTSGVYTLSSLPPDSYTLTAYREGYSCSPSFVSPITVPPDAADKDFTCMPAACSNLIDNGSFEERTAWEIPSTEYTARYSTDIAHTGITSMRTGIVNPADNRYSYSSARQLVNIPWDANLAKLRFYRFPISGEIYTSTPEDLFRLLPALPTVGDRVEEDVLSGDIQMVLILDYYDNIISTLMWGLSDRQAWQYREFDLMAYRGWTIKVYFGTYNDGWGGVSAQYIDDVSLEVCQE